MPVVPTGQWAITDGRRNRVRELIGMRILATFAVDWEFKPWLRLRSFEQTAGGESVFQSKIAGSDVRVVLTGVGPMNSMQSIRAAMDEVPDLCIATGLAGGLKPEYRTGDILVARKASSQKGRGYFKSDGRLFDTAVECGAKAVNEFISAEHVVRTANGKSRLADSADAVDMESFAIMREMNGLNIPCVAVRCVADSAEMDVPCDFDRALDSSGRIRISRVIGQVICDPRQAWPLAQFGTRSSRAAASLAHYLDNYTNYLVEHKEKMDLSVQQIGQ